MSIRVLINGAKGKMGQEAVKAITEDASLQLVCEAHHGDNLAELIARSQAQLVIDLTVATAAYKNTLLIIQSGAHPVIGTSGLTPEQIAELQSLCASKKLGGIIVPNFSIAAVLMMRFAEQAAHYYPHCEIIEMHHAAKLDSPSGTSLKTASIIAHARSKPPIFPQEKQTLAGARGANVEGVPIHAVRLPGIVACQEVLFGGEQETLSIKHQTIHRSAFMPGLKLACKKVVDLKNLVYGLEHIL